MSPPNQGNPSRREWLTGSRPDVDPANVAKFGPLFEFSSNAMGCEFQIICTQDAQEPLAHAVIDAFDMIADLELQMSIYRDSSEMSTINRMADRAPVMVEQNLFGVLQTAQKISLATQGAFDLSATPLGELWKASRQQRKLPSQTSIDSARQFVDFTKVQLDEASHTIQFQQTGIKLDLGGIGKGHALDRIRNYLHECTCFDFLIHGGQSSVLASGQRSDLEDNQHPWQIGLAHPLLPNKRLGTLTINDQAVGTSGSGRQSFIVDGKRYGHIIAPRTGWPVDHTLSVTVLAESAVVADALATALFVIGPQDAESVCEQFNAGALFVSEDTPNGPLKIDTVRLPPDCLALDNDNG